MPAYSIAMVAACPFPANHGTPAAIKEMSEELARRGHLIRVVTYPLSDDIPVAGIEINRVGHVGRNREINVGPSYQRLVFDAMLAIKLFQIVRRHEVDVIHAHNYEAMLIGGVVGRLTGVPVIYNAINTMISELPSYNFFRPRVLATGRSVNRLHRDVRRVSRSRLPDDRFSDCPRAQTHCQASTCEQHC